jgi:hypothetical protein
MKNSIFILATLLCLSMMGLCAQDKLFSLYTDSASLVRDAEPMVADFNKRVNAIIEIPVMLTPLGRLFR